MRAPKWLLSILIGAAGANGMDDTNSEPLQNKTKIDSLSACSQGELNGCTKSSAMVSWDRFTSRQAFASSEHTEFTRSSRRVEKFLGSEAKSVDSSWTEFAWTMLERVGAFAADELTQADSDAPRFLDEIASEIDALEDKNDNIFSRTKMKKLLIPLLLVLKVFKLKLLLFLPLILGLVSFKKLIGVLIFTLPALIGFLKLAKLREISHSYGSFGHSSYYNLPPHRRYQLAADDPGVYSRYAPPPPPTLRDKHRDAYQYAGTHQSLASPQGNTQDDRHHLAYNSYQRPVNK
ncbi:unnamed protein product [Bemisia tabaci]|uniref:Uncharacterized protein n=1 Tax=Bemisia tabaci TaxID=7038 RepID=A0A9P0ADN2_BEMTA|nr:unnamed protein product [Bemisia tabaci]